MDDHMDRLSQALGHWFEPRGFEVDWRVLDPGPDGMNISLGGASARIAAVVHDETSVALRVQSAGVEVVYSGDSDDCPALTGLCYGADVAVLECSTAVDNKVPGHLTAREVARIACQAQVGGVVLVHMYPELDGVDLAAQIAAYGYRGWVVPACDGYVVEV